MRIIEEVAGFEAIPKEGTLSIGNFDGVHLGHRAIIEAAKLTNKPLVVMTFEPHPEAVLNPDTPPGVLTPLPMKAGLLEEAGADFLVVVPGTAELLNLAPADFIERFIVRGLRPSVVVEGPDFRFGRNRRGSLDTLGEFASIRGFQTKMVETVEVKLDNRAAIKVSSTLVRDQLRQGRVENAAAALGRYYRLTGPAVTGRGKGTELGFPTANMGSTGQIIPAEGVYAGFLQVGEDFEQVCRRRQLLPAALSLGRAATFNTKNPVLIEAHVLDRQIADLSGKQLAIDFVKRLRSQRRFDGARQLKDQISLDCREAAEVLSGKARKNA